MTSNAMNRKTGESQDQKTGWEGGKSKTCSLSLDERLNSLDYPIIGLQAIHASKTESNHTMLPRNSLDLYPVTSALPLPQTFSRKFSPVAHHTGIPSVIRLPTPLGKPTRLRETNIYLLAYKENCRQAPYMQVGQSQFYR